MKEGRKGEHGLHMNTELSSQDQKAEIKSKHFLLILQTNTYVPTLSPAVCPS